MSMLEEVSNVAVFLASDDASYISGVNLLIDCGRLAMWKKLQIFEQGCERTFNT